MKREAKLHLLNAGLALTGIVGGGIIGADIAAHQALSLDQLGTVLSNLVNPNNQSFTPEAFGMWTGTFCGVIPAPIITGFTDVLTRPQVSPAIQAHRRA